MAYTTLENMMRVNYSEKTPPHSESLKHQISLHAGKLKDIYSSLEERTSDAQIAYLSFHIVYNDVLLLVIEKNNGIDISPGKIKSVGDEIDKIIIFLDDKYESMENYHKEWVRTSLLRDSLLYLRARTLYGIVVNQAMLISSLDEVGCYYFERYAPFLVFDTALKDLSTGLKDVQDKCYIRTLFPNSS